MSSDNPMIVCPLRAITLDNSEFVHVTHTVSPLDGPNGSVTVVAAAFVRT